MNQPRMADESKATADLKAKSYSQLDVRCARITGKPEVILRTSWKVLFSVNRFPGPGKAGKLPEIPFFRHFVM